MNRHTASFAVISYQFALTFGMSGFWSGFSRGKNPLD